MPEESIAAYVNNIITFTLFIVIIVFIFGILFLLSHILVRRTGSRENTELKGETFPSGSLNLFNYKRDPYRVKNIFILGVIFIVVITFIFFIIAVFNYSKDPAAGLNLYLIIGIVFYLVLMAVYLVKSKIIS